MPAHPIVAAVSDRRRRSEIDATIYVPLYNYLFLYPWGMSCRSIMPDGDCKNVDGGLMGKPRGALLQAKF
jgi:hypothetical protein